ncbi:uncharacterized protein LOC116265493 [Nymphaea colorata]|nr:uncharacterized protein LOC116265493 [Nymphaea colorata]
MVKAYLRYEPAAVFGVVASVESNVCYDNTGKLLFTGALEQLCVWNLKQGLCIKALASSTSSSGPKSAASAIACSPSSDSTVACGYADGSIKIWDFVRGTCETTLNGHKGAVTALRYNKNGSLLASGSKDNDIILWDVVGEAGLFRLRGHKDQVTDLIFLESGKKLISCSKDKFVRVWDIDTQHCMQIIGGHQSEVWSLDVNPGEKYMVTGSADQELRFYKIQSEPQDGRSHLATEDGPNNNLESGTNKWQILKQFGEIKRQSKDRVVTVRFNKVGNLIACQVAGKTVELFRVLDDDEAKRKAKKRVQRKKEKLLNKKTKELGESGDVTLLSKDEVASPVPVVSDVFRFLQTLQTKKKICSLSFCPAAPKNPFLETVALSLNNNMIEVYSIQTDSSTKVHTVYLPGHRSDIRSVALSSDSTMLMSTSHDSVKIWNPSSGSCLRTIESGYGLCSLFVPGNRFALIGTKSGTLEVIDIGSSSRTELIEAHTDAVRSLVSLPNKSGFITSSADHDVKFWDYQIVERDGHASKQLTVHNTRTLKMDDDALVVRVSHDSKYIAVSLLDSTIKVFFMDTLKFFLSLYGHSLPVLCMDISYDGDLLVSGSGDKNLKIWGLDFGDCHKSIFAHADSITGVQFVRNTHYVFSVGKDRLVKYWDADKFELLLTLEGHHAAVWCLSVSEHGDFLVTGSSDRSIRRWDRTEEPFFVEEEREKRLEEMFESGLDDPVEGLYAPKEELPDEGAVSLAGKQTQETLNSTDKLIDALDMAEMETQRILQHKEDVKAGKASILQPNVMMRGLSPSEYVLHTISSVHSSDLVQTLLLLPFTDALRLMTYLKDWIEYPDKVELICRITTVLLQIHHNQLVATPTARPVLTLLQGILYKRVKECKDTLGFNLAAMDHLKQLMASKSDAPFRDAKAKLMEIRAKYSIVTGKKSDAEERKSKKQKKSNYCRWFSDLERELALTSIIFWGTVEVTSSW